TTSAPKSTSTMPLARMHGSAIALSQPATTRVELQLHRAFRLDRFVNCGDQLETLAALQAIDEVPMVVKDALHYVLIVAMVSEPVHIGRVDRVLFHHLIIARQRLRKVPSTHLIQGKPRDFHAAALAENRDRAFQVLRPGGGGRLD